MTPPRVVFDAVVFIQAMITDRGASAACIDASLAGKATLFISDTILAEIRDVSARPELTRRYRHLTPDMVDAFVRALMAVAIHVPVAPKVFSLPRDAKDEPYIDLAVGVNASFLVTWNDRHLTYLMRRDTAEGRDFCDKFPGLQIVTPPDLLRAVRK